MAMSRRRKMASTTVAVGTLIGVLGTSSASAHPRPSADASEVVHWNLVATSTLGAIPGPDGGAPPAFAINMGIVQGAVYDAVNAIEPKKHRPYVLHKRVGSRASVDAAVATAAYDVLSALVTSAPARIEFPKRAELLSALSRERDASLVAVHRGSAKKQGITIGHAAARAMLKARKGDGRFGPSAWTSNTTVGHWQPLLVNGTAALDPTPWAGNVTPFTLKRPSQFRSAPPPDLDSQQWAAEFNEVKLLGRATSLARSTDQTYIAKWWQSAPVFSWNEVSRQLIDRTDLSAAKSARLLALQNFSGADASINCWNDKYHFDFWRPWNAIARAAEDGNAATEPDATWTALITAPYPEWVSGHNCLDTANTTVLRAFFGDDPVGGPFHITTHAVNTGGDEVRAFDTFSEPLTELIEARIWAGLHYRSADVAGQLLGRNVANYAMAHYLRPVHHQR